MQVKMASDIESDSLHLRVPPAGSPNAHSRRSATNEGIATFTANGLAVANNLLAALPRKECRQLIDDMQPVALTCGDVLHEPEEQMEYVYFPNDCVVALLTLAHQHQALGIGLVGREGMVGISLALGIGTSPLRALVQSSGTAMRMKAAAFLKELRQNHALQRELHRYAYALMVQITQTAACNHYYFVEARLARWLLMTDDRMQSGPFRLSQEFLAKMLGVRRVGVNKAARSLQKNKLISYSRSNITILDRKGLEAYKEKRSQHWCDNSPDQCVSLIEEV